MRAERAVLPDVFGLVVRLRSPASPAAPERTAGVDGERFRAAYGTRRIPYGRADVSGPARWKGVGEVLGVPLDECPAGRARRGRRGGPERGHPGRRTGRRLRVAAPENAGGGTAHLTARAPPPAASLSQARPAV